MRSDQIITTPHTVIMKITQTDLPEVKIIQPKVHHDPRGFFFESYNQQAFEKCIGKSVHFSQDNHSMSKKGVLRGLHYQLPPKAQGKLVRVIQGEIFDVAVDIRHNSPTFGRWVGHILSSENQQQIWIPEGFAHGFLVLSDMAECLYKTTNYYAPEHERTIYWNAPELAIDWGIDKPILSKKDQNAPTLRNAQVFT